MRVWTIANQKGGVGKTTTAVSLAGTLARQGQRVLLVDLDAQASLTSYFKLDPERLAATSYHLFPVSGGELAVDSVLQDLPVEGAKLIPASTALATVERQMVGREGMGLVVKRMVSALSGQFDQVLIDSPPSLGVLLINAIAAADRVIIPVQTEFLAIKGLERTLRTLSMVARSRPTPLAYTVVPTMFDRRTQASKRALQTLRIEYADHLWPAVIPVDTRLRDASARGVSIAQLEPSGRAGRAYEALVRYLDTHTQAAA